MALYIKAGAELERDAIRCDKVLLGHASFGWAAIRGSNQVRKGGAINRGDTDIAIMCVVMAKRLSRDEHR